MKIWDRGTYETHKFREDEVMVTFHGERLHGRYVLFRTRGDDWMIHRMDPPEDPDREPMPERLPPMLARTGTLPRDKGEWAYEIKWDGVRAIGYVDGGRLRLESRNGNDITPRYPELRALGPALGSRDAILDGEVVAFEDGRPSFQKLQGRMHLTSEHAVRRLAQSDPVIYMIFDVLWLEGHSLLELTYEERRAKLAELELSGPTWQTPAQPHRQRRAACSRPRAPRGSRASSPSGSTAPTRPGGARTAGSRSRTSAAPTPSSAAGCPARRAARAASARSWSASTRTASCATRAASAAASPRRSSRALGKLLDGLARDDSPFSGRQPPKETRFVDPRLVCVVDYSEVTQAKTLRQPSYKGLRDDIAPEDVGSPDPV